MFTNDISGFGMAALNNQAPIEEIPQAAPTVDDEISTLCATHFFPKPISNSASILSALRCTSSTIISLEQGSAVPEPRLMSKAQQTAWSVAFQVTNTRGGILADRIAHHFKDYFSSSENVLRRENLQFAPTSIIRRWSQLLKISPDLPESVLIATIQDLLRGRPATASECCRASDESINNIN
jgi:hypothetical protein